jgi:DNA-binding transcriptional LysR family regulator
MCYLSACNYRRSVMASADLAGIDLNLLVLFEALLIERNVSRAARRLGLAQPSASNALNRLRALFGDDLFIRTPQEMRPTPRALELAAPIISALQQVRSALEPPAAFDPATVARRFTLAGAHNVDFALALVGLRLSQAAPHAEFDLIAAAGSDPAYSMLDAGSLDIAVGVFRAVPKRFNAVSLYWERYVCLADGGHPELVDGLTLEKFVALPHAGVAREAGIIDAALAKRGLQRRVAIRVPLYALIPYIFENRLLAVVGERIGHHLTTLMNVRSYPVPLDLQPWNVSAVWLRQDNPDKALTWLVTLLRQASALLP